MRENRVRYCARLQNTTYAKQNYTYEYRYKYTNVGYVCRRHGTVPMDDETRESRARHGVYLRFQGGRERIKRRTREPTRGDRVPYHASDFLHFSFLVLKIDDTRSPKVSPASSSEGTIDFRGEVASPRNLCPLCPPPHFLIAGQTLTARVIASRPPISTKNFYASIYIYVYIYVCIFVYLCTRGARTYVHVYM